MPELTAKQKEIIQGKENILVMANPGTGKTFILSSKFLSAIQNGVRPEQILCLTFTDKARQEMESRIVRLLLENQIRIDSSKLQIKTFHSYAMEKLEQPPIIPSNFLRFTIFEYIKENHLFDYEPSYLISEIASKIERLILFLKSFGITPDKIDLEKTKSLLQNADETKLDEKHKFAEEFVTIFNDYEKTKSEKGVDYTDLLIKFLALKNIPKHKLVLVDELQDLNRMEADIALKSSKEFFAVGDKKQAIFGFQGGSITNFDLFQSNSRQFVLSDNFRSTDAILNYAKDYFLSKTKDPSHKKELEDLKSADGRRGDPPIIYKAKKEFIPDIASELLKRYAQEQGHIAVITRTNRQITEISKRLTNNGINHSSTCLVASGDAKLNVIRFLKGILSNDLLDVRNALFTTFAPVPLRTAFEITQITDLTLEKLERLTPEFANLRQFVKSLEHVNELFKNNIIPIAVSHGREYFLASTKIQDAFRESVEFLSDIKLENLIAYLESTNLNYEAPDTESKITVTTIHKAKGREFDTVIYFPGQTSNKSNYQDEVVESILKTHGIDAGQQIYEEGLRTDFVAFTRAKNKLVILSDSSHKFMNQYAVEGNLSYRNEEGIQFNESQKKAYSFFVAREFDKARELLDKKEKWITDYVFNYFNDLNNISFSFLMDKAYEYLVTSILRIREQSEAITIGLEVHRIAEKIVNEGNCDCTDDFKPLKDNINALISLIKKEYPDNYAAEKFIKIPLNEFIDTEKGGDMYFTGHIDAIFQNGDNYFIIDWKTDRNQNRGSTHRQQLAAYKRAFCIAHKIDTDKVRVGICFVRLRSALNTGELSYLLDNKQPNKRAFETFSKRLNKVLKWKRDPESFLSELSETERGEALWRSIVEQYLKEKAV